MKPAVPRPEVQSRPIPGGAKAAAGTLLGLLAAVMLAGQAHAQGAIHLGAGDCSAAGSSTAAVTNACTSNTGAITLVASYSPPAPMPRFEALEADVVIFTNGATLSPWWHFEGSPAPGCRAGRISVSADFTSYPGTCMDFWSGQAAAGLYVVANDANVGPGAAHIRVGLGVPESLMGSISPSIEYYGFSLTIQKNQSTGPGSCPGCLDRACFVLNSVALSQPAPVPDFVITQGTQNVVTYNGGTGGSNCTSAITQARSWGSIKAIYR